ncbi:hypothetical protein WJX81_006779 [Elliptochloris bilobata]|uniref:Uncharacterized protein n=1 Tax=Elliptochloris bilobata TaxID=381761 RepID=A0AAW1S8Y9_9CHLO
MTYVEQSNAAAAAWREWDDTPGCSLCKCCGDCGCDCERGWGLCCLTFWCSCVTFGFNSRDMFNKSAAVQATIFFVLLILPGIVYGGVNWHTTSQRSHCVTNGIHTLQAQREAHGVTQADDVTYINSVKACQAIPLYTKAAIALLVVHYVLMIAGLAYVALHRAVVRRKLRIKPCCGCAPGSCLSFLGEWCLLFWCLQCALCQERRTLHKLRVRNAVIGADQFQSMQGGNKDAPAFHTMVAASHSAYAQPAAHAGEGHV